MHPLGSFICRAAATAPPVLFFCLLGIACSLAGAATVHKTDDTTVTGDISAIADATLTITAKPKPLVIPFDQIAQIVLKEPAAPPPPPPVAVDNNPAVDDSPSLLGMLFGSGRSHSHTDVPATVAPVTTVPVVVTTHPSSQPADGPAVQIALADGDSLHAKLGTWADQKVTFNLPAGQSIDLPSTAIIEIWFGAADQQKKAKALTVEPGPEDVAFVTRENDVIAVKGLAQGIAGESLHFRYGDEDRKIGLSKIVGLLLRSNASVPLGGFHQRVHTDNGDRLSGTLTGLDHDLAILTTSTGPIKIPLRSVMSIEFVNGRVTSLCDLKPAQTEQTPYFGRVIAYRIDQSLTGGPLVMSDGTCARGIAVHSRCVLSYDLPGDVDRFKTRLGFQQPEGLKGRVSARVLGDGKVLYENPDARGDQPPIDIDVPLAGAHSLTLEIDFGKDQDVGDRVVWGNPRLVRGK